MTTLKTNSIVDFKIRLEIYESKLEYLLNNHTNESLLIKEYSGLLKEHNDINDKITQREHSYKDFLKIFKNIPYLYKQMNPTHTYDVVKELAKKQQLNLKKLNFIKTKISHYIKSSNIIRKYWLRSRYDPKYKLCRQIIFKKAEIFK